ncbi:NAD(P)/FAD-dependent oxidoreductase [Bombilactobacillus folatiphilus]|uniref:NAD(P)/FAD-dependent oxidoreductase n=1 Tax=Bombilactobacillus folatiphilus TaxID=2923362 RepID=A0ABY4P910_9LACO|nr:FAD/NAD(P)-binding oxidoreductase [Bombilactobacillus folatiphilus]UQS82220.1 NAD(P)/FAD-dependent oxidoreductase [Bombilactobacillus folatiphilus]
MRLFIIGGSFAGISCARQARQLYPHAQITVIERSPTLGFIPGGLVLYLRHKVEHLEDAVFVTPTQLAAAQIDLHLQEQLIAIDPKHHQITTDQRQYSYDKLVLAMGSEQQSLNINLDGTDWNSSFKTYLGAQKALKIIQKAQTLTIIGAGQSGMELASALIANQKAVNLIETASYPLFKYFDQDFLQPFIRDLQTQQQLQLYFDTTIKQIKQHDGFAVQVNGNDIQSDYIFGTVNVHPPKNQLTQQFALNVDNTLQTNQYLETSIPDIFAIGDLIHAPAQQPNELGPYLAQVTHALRSGQVAAYNLQQAKIPCNSGVKTVGTQMFDWYLASSGLLEANAFSVQSDIDSHIFCQNYSLLNPQPMYYKAIYTKDTHQLLGLQIMSKVNCLAKINPAALAIQQGLTLEALMQSDYFFQPEFTNLSEPLNRLSLGSDRSDAL